MLGVVEEEVCSKPNGNEAWAGTLSFILDQPNPVAPTTKNPSNMPKIRHSGGFFKTSSSCELPSKNYQILPKTLKM